MRRSLIALALAAMTLGAVAACLRPGHHSKCAKFRGKTVFSNSQMRILKQRDRTATGRGLRSPQREGPPARTEQVAAAAPGQPTKRQAGRAPVISRPSAGRRRTGSAAASRRPSSTSAGRATTTSPATSYSDAVPPTARPPPRATVRLAPTAAAPVLAVGKATPSFHQTSTHVAPSARRPVQQPRDRRHAHRRSARCRAAARHASWTKCGLARRRPDPTGYYVASSAGRGRARDV